MKTNSADNLISDFKPPETKLYWLSHPACVFCYSSLSILITQHAYQVHHCFLDITKARKQLLSNFRAQNYHWKGRTDFWASLQLYWIRMPEYFRIICGEGPVMWWLILGSLEPCPLRNPTSPGKFPYNPKKKNKTNICSWYMRIK